MLLASSLVTDVSSKPARDLELQLEPKIDHAFSLVMGPLLFVPKKEK